MATYESFYNTLCRVCLMQGNIENMVSLIDESSSYGLSCFGIALCKFVNISVKKDDCLPNLLCPNCLFLLKQAIRLKLICETTERRLTNVVNIIGQSRMDRENIIKKVSEHVLFGTYFNKTHTEEPDNIKHHIIQDKTNRNRLLKVEIQLEPLEGSPCEETNNYDHNFKDKSDNTIVENMDHIYKVNKDILKTKVCHRNKNGVNKKQILKLKKALLKRERKKKENFKQNLVCELCNKVLASKLSLRIHMQRHTGGRFMCEYCAKHYPTNEELQVHQVCSHGTGRYIQCSKCPFKAPRKKEFKEHERLHTGERPFACEKCGLTFRTRYIWRKHARYHEEKSVQCLHCPLKFHLKSEMKAHVNNMHERLYMYMCNQCGATYSTTQTVRIHLTKKHGIARELQGPIKRIFKGKDSEFPEQ